MSALRGPQNADSIFATYDDRYISRIFCCYILAKIIFYDLIFLQGFYGWVISRWTLEVLYYFVNVK